MNQYLISDHNLMNYDARLLFDDVVKGIVDGIDVRYVKELMERWFFLMHAKDGSQCTLASFCLMVKSGLVNGAGYEFLDDKGNSPLFWAAYYDRCDVVVMLIKDYQFSVNRQNLNGDSPLHFAVKGASIECSRTLIAAGADVNIYNLQGETPLHMAICAGIDFVELLIQSSAYLDCEDEYGDTPLHWAVREDNFECVRMLLDAGADKYHGNEDGETPIHFSEVSNLSFNLH